MRRLALFIPLALLPLATGCREAPTGPPTQDGKKLIEVSVFQGGYGIDFWQQSASAYERLHPDVKINIWGDPRNDEKLRPRFIAGTPPDLVYANLPIWILIGAKQCFPLTKYLAEPPYEDARGAGSETRGAGVSPAVSVSPASGKLAVIFVNVTDKPVKSQWVFDWAQYGFAKAKKLRLALRTEGNIGAPEAVAAKFTRTLEVPARTAWALELTPE